MKGRVCQCVGGGALNSDGVSWSLSAEGETASWVVGGRAGARVPQTQAPTPALPEQLCSITTDSVARACSFHL